MFYLGSLSGSQAAGMEKKGMHGQIWQAEMNELQKGQEEIRRGYPHSAGGHFPILRIHTGRHFIFFH